jgi:hypothetical protein
VIHSHQGTRDHHHKIEHDHDGADDHTHVILTHDLDLESGILDEYEERYGPPEPSAIDAVIQRRTLLASG